MVEEELNTAERNDSKCSNIEENEAKFESAPTFQINDIQLKEDVKSLELSDEICESDLSVIEYTEPSEENNSLERKSALNNSMAEYDKKVLEIVARIGMEWSCTKCTYSSKSKGHVLEHAEMHIEGYSHECKYCDKTFTRKRALRHHVRKCKQIFSKASLSLSENSF